MEIRVATPQDVPALLGIYAPYVEGTAITFEYAVPTQAEFARRIAATLQAYPYLVAVQEGRIVGYAYAGRLHTRAAYDWSAEASIYVAMDAHGQGVGKALYQALEDILRRQHVVCLTACIAYADPEDTHLTNASMRFHQHMGYTCNAHFHRCAYKFDAWYDMIWMEKSLGERRNPPLAFVPFSQLD